MRAKELKRLNHKAYLKAFISANADMHIKMAFGYVKGMEAAHSYRTNPEKLPTTAKFWFSPSIFANGFRSAFIMYAGNEARNEVNKRFTDIMKCYESLDK